MRRRITTKMQKYKNPKNKISGARKKLSILKSTKHKVFKFFFLIFLVKIYSNYVYCRYVAMYVCAKYLHVIFFSVNYIYVNDF